jgi:sterol desaturase/sphingolipid hydroxylase (fatty acid hydroxylase superfamily)
VPAESTIRLASFILVLAVLALWEVLAPRRRRQIPRLLRWSNNFAVVVLDTVILRLTFPVLAVGFAAMTAERGWGLFNLVDAPRWVAIALSIVVLDVAIYLQHVLFHTVPVLWRLHRMHHTDPEFDVSTGIRFHPAEVMLSMGIKLAVITLLGAPAVGVLAFEVLLNATSMFNHSNIRLPAAADRWLRLLVVTPDMHRVHHSVHVDETNSNFGFNVPWWDRQFGTYAAQPKDGHEEMTIGLAQFRSRRELWLDRLLTQPVRRPPDDEESSRHGV